MMICECGQRLNVFDTRPRNDGTTRRRYKCPKCESRYTTIEQFSNKIEGSRFHEAGVTSYELANIKNGVIKKMMAVLGAELEKAQ